MDDVLHTFKKGHRIKVQIQSTWFPLVDLNPQKFVDINSAHPEDFQTATQRVYHSAAHPSQIGVRVLPRE
jgi:predicted acyl esterase